MLLKKGLCMQFSFNKKKVILWTRECVCIYFVFPTCCPLETLEVIANKNIVMLGKDLLHTRINGIVTNNTKNS